MSEQENENARLRGALREAYAIIALLLEQDEGCAFIPDEALVRMGERHYVESVRDEMRMGLQLRLVEA